MSSKNTVNVTVNISQFPTDVLIEELYNRIVDHMEDPEPQYDPVLEGITDGNKVRILSTLVRHK